MKKLLSTICLSLVVGICYSANFSSGDNMGDCNARNKSVTNAYRVNSGTGSYGGIVISTSPESSDDYDVSADQLYPIWIRKPLPLYFMYLSTMTPSGGDNQVFYIYAQRYLDEYYTSIWGNNNLDLCSSWIGFRNIVSGVDNIIVKCDSSTPLNGAFYVLTPSSFTEDAYFEDNVVISSAIILSTAIVKGQIILKDGTIIDSTSTFGSSGDISVLISSMDRTNSIIDSSVPANASNIAILMSSGTTDRTDIDILLSSVTLIAESTGFLTTLSTVTYVTDLSTVTFAAAESTFTTYYIEVRLPGSVVQSTNPFIALPGLAVTVPTISTYVITGYQFFTHVVGDWATGFKIATGTVADWGYATDEVSVAASTVWGTWTDINLPVLAGTQFAVHISSAGSAVPAEEGGCIFRITRKKE